MFLTPTRFPDCHGLLPVCFDCPTNSSAPVAGEPAMTPDALGGATNQAADAAQHSVDDAYASGEAIIVALARAALHVHNGWRAYQRLLALQPLLRYSSSDASVDSSRVASCSGVASEWAVLPVALGGRTLQGRRLLALALSGALQESSSTRRTRHTVSNLVALTAMLDREFTFKDPSGTRCTRRAGAATPAADGMRSRGSSSLPLSLLARGKEAVLRTMTSQSRRPQSTTGTADDAGGATSCFEPDSDVVLTPVELAGGESSKGDGAAVLAPPPPRLSFAPEPAAIKHFAPEGVDPELRFDGCLARLVLVAWDDLLVPSPDEAERFLAMTCEALPASGSLLHMLMNLSLWALRAYPVDHPVVLAALARLQRLQASLFGGLRLLNPTYVDTTMPQAPLPTPVPDGKPPRSKPATSRDASAVAFVPTRIASFLQSSSGRERGASVVSSSGGDDDWEEVEQLGRPGVPVEAWLCFVLSQLHALFRRLRDEVLAARARQPATLRVTPGLLEPHSATAELGIALLKDLVQVRIFRTRTELAVDCRASLPHVQLGGGQPAASAHLSFATCKAFISQYDHVTASLKSLKTSSRKAVLARDNSLAHNGVAKGASEPVQDEELRGADVIASSTVDPWDWLVPSSSTSAIAEAGLLRPKPLPALSPSMATSETVGIVASSGVGKSSLPAGDSSVHWVVEPGWSASMNDAVDTVNGALEQATEEIDDALASLWQQALASLRDDSGLVEPLHRPMLASRRQQFDRRASKASARSGSAPSPSILQPSSSTDVSARDSGPAAPASGVVASAANAATAVSVVAAGLGRSAFKRITAAGNQVKRGIANIAAMAAGLDLEASGDAFPADGEVLPPDLQEASESRLHWIPGAVLDQVRQCLLPVCPRTRVMRNAPVLSRRRCRRFGRTGLTGSRCGALCTPKESMRFKCCRTRTSRIAFAC